MPCCLLKFSKKKNRLIILSYSDMYVLLFSWGAEKYCFLFLQQNILLLTQIWVLDKLQGWRASGEYLISFSYHRSSLSSRAIKLWCLVLVGKVMELDAVGCQFKPYPYSRMCLHADGALVVWPGMLFQNSWGYSSCHSQEQLLLTWKRPLFALTRPTAQAVPECSPKSSSIEFAIKNFVCLLEEPSGRIDRWQAGAQTWTQTWTLQPDKGYICSEIPE